MLDDRLTAEERRALLDLLITVALTDGKLSDAEVQFVQRVALPIGVEVGELLARADVIVFADVCAVLAKRPYSARLAVIELLRLAHADDVYARAEQAAIVELAARLDVSHPAFEQLEAWVRREWALLAEARGLLDAE